MAKTAYRVRNWKEYNEALVRRGSVTFWFSEEIQKEWCNKKRTNSPGRPKNYTDFAIESALILKVVFKLSFRATQGFINSLVQCMRLSLPVPNYSTLCKRQKDLKVKLPCVKKGGCLDIVVDTTGLKIFGEGEWKVRQHGQSKKRVWRKLHIAVNAKTQQIESCLITECGLQDCQGLPPLLKQVSGVIGDVIGDGAYDRFSCYEEANRYHCRGIFPPQHNAKTSPERPRNKNKASIEAVKRRDEVIEEVRNLGREEWKRGIGYHRRSLAETAMFRVKTLCGSRLSARLIPHQATEARIWCKAINKMTLIGLPHAAIN